MEPAQDMPSQFPTLATEQKDTYLEEGELPDDPKLSRKVATQFVMLNGLLHFPDLKRRFKKRAVVPVQLREKLMGDVHGGPLAGHFSTSRLFNTLARTCRNA